MNIIIHVYAHCTDGRHPQTCFIPKYVVVACIVCAQCVVHIKCAHKYVVVHIVCAQCADDGHPSLDTFQNMLLHI